MQTYDVSRRVEPTGHLGPLLRVVPTLDQHLGRTQYMVIGAHARDLVVHVVAGQPLGRATHDVDISVAMPSRRALEANLDRLGPRGGLRTRRIIADLPVDVLPFGDITDGQLFDDEDVQYDVTGMSECHRAGILLRLTPTATVRVPSLAGMIVLKIAAWRARREERDAQDLGVLLAATSSGSYLDDLWSPGSGAEEFDYDPELAGPYVQGRQIATELEPATRERLLDVVSTDDLDRISILTTRQEHVQRLRREQLAVFGRAVRESSPDPLG